MKKCTMRFTFFCLSFVVFFPTLNLFASIQAGSSEPGKDFKKFKEKCWPKDKRETLSGLMQALIRQPLETIHQNNNYIQTFGCAYEDDDINRIPFVPYVGPSISRCAIVGSSREKTLLV